MDKEKSVIWTKPPGNGKIRRKVQIFHIHIKRSISEMHSLTKLDSSGEVLIQQV